MRKPHDVSRDLYAYLGVASDASQLEINRAYRRLARNLHPDTALAEDADRDRFQQVSEAHAVLSDPDRRRAYDRTYRGSGSKQVFAAACPVCQGRRLIQLPCGRCGAIGYLLTNAPWLRHQVRCPSCRGRGGISSPCGACNATGRTTNSS
jgi:DnaJ-class molecular chaperone